jgi:hypothetical protein
MSKDINENKSNQHKAVFPKSFIIIGSIAFAIVALLFVGHFVCTLCGLTHENCTIEICIAICAMAAVTICAIVCFTVLSVCEIQANKSNSIKELDDQFLEKVYGIVCADKTTPLNNQPTKNITCFSLFNNTKA